MPTIAEIDAEIKRLRGLPRTAAVDNKITRLLELRRDIILRRRR